MKKLIIPLACLMTALPALAQEGAGYSTTAESRPWVSRVGLMFEPSIQLVSQTSNIRTSGLPIISQDTSAKVSGYGFGARITGHVYETLFVGADARYSRVDMNDSSLGQATGDSYNFAPVIGLQMPIAGLRIWYSRIIAGGYNPAAGSSGVDLKFGDATGNRIGAGFHLMAVSLNLEYEELTFNKTDIQSVGPLSVNSSTGVDYDQRGYLASISFPISF